MKSSATAKTIQIAFGPELWYDGNAPTLAEPSGRSSQIRLLSLQEINEETSTRSREAIANVISAIEPDSQASLVYILEGGPNGISLYFGLVAAAGVDIYEPMRDLRGTLEGQLPGVVFGERKDHSDVLSRFASAAYRGLAIGVPTLNESEKSDAENDTQGVDRLARSLLSSGLSSGDPNESYWQVVLVAEPLTSAEIRSRLDAAQSLASNLALLSRTSIQTGSNDSTQRSTSIGDSKTQGKNESRSENWGKNESASESKSWGENRGSSDTSSSSSRSKGTNTGGSQSKTVGNSTGSSLTTGANTSVSRSENVSLSKTQGTNYGITQEVVNKRNQWFLERLEKEIIPRLEKGLTKGLFRCALYLTSEDVSTYRRLKSAVRATYQGDAATINPISVLDLPSSWTMPVPNLPANKQKINTNFSTLMSFDSAIDNSAGTLWNSGEISLIAGLPQRELPGLRRRKCVSFAIDLPKGTREDALTLGPVIDFGRRFPIHQATLERKDLNKHIFITGVTGAGKTTTCLKLLKEARLPFLVLEPAKTEYRALVKNYPGDISFYRPNGDPAQSLRINPFALIRKGQHIKSHASFLKNVFATIFPLEASMPQMVEAAILESYKEKGWDISFDEWLDEGDPFDPKSQAWPTMSDMIRQLDRIIPTYNLGREFEEKYRGSLVSRLRGLVDGTLGDLLDVHQSIDWHDLLRRNVVIELEELQSGEDKALLMALILGAINEAIRDLHREDRTFRHLTLVEEAHRLLSKPEPGDSARAMAVEAFADMLAEVRKYGEGLIIADQIPAKLIPDVIKNTHTKIVHRLFAEDDRRTMAEAMMMDQDQRDFLPNLKTGEVIVFCGGWHGPAHVAIDSGKLRTDGEPLIDDSLYRIFQDQLWRSRYRYYPTLCILVEGEKSIPLDSSTFARFVSDGKRAWSMLIRLLSTPNSDDTNDKKRNSALKWLHRWLDHWLATMNPEILANTMVSVLIDSVPKARASVANPTPVIEDPLDTHEVEKFQLATRLLLEAIRELDVASNLKSVLASKNTAGILNRLRPLEHYRGL